MKSKRKIFLAKLLGFMAIGALIGAISSFVLKEEIIFLVGETVKNTILSNSFLIFIICTFSYQAICLILYFRGKAKIEKELENDDIINDNSLSIGLSLSNVGFMFSLASFMVLASYTFSQFPSRTSMIQLSLGGVLLIISVVTYSFYQQVLVNLIKSYDPSKYDDVLDFQFNKKWVETSDEREKYEIYKAGFKAYRAMTTASFISLFLIGFSYMISGIGLLALLISLVIYSIGTAVYTLEILNK